IHLVEGVFGEGIKLDPCSNQQSIVQAEYCYCLDRGINGLETIWSGFETVYVNPPYGREIGKWVDKCNDEASNGIEIIALLPARTDAKWFQVLWDAEALCFWRGRIRFLGAPSSAPFPSVVAYWGQFPYRFADVFSAAGFVVFP